MITVYYGDHPGNITFVFSKHRTRDAAERRMNKAKQDPYWKNYFFALTPTAPLDRKLKS